MSSNRQYTDEFRAEAVKQVIDRGFTVVDVAARIGIPKHTLYEWVHRARKDILVLHGTRVDPPPQRQQAARRPPCYRLPDAVAARSSAIR